MWGADTHRQTHTQTHTHTHTQIAVTTVHFASSTTYAKCNKLLLGSVRYQVWDGRDWWQCGQSVVVGWLEFNVPFHFSAQMLLYQRRKVRVESYPFTQWRKASDILTSTLAAFLFSSHQKRERDREAHLNYYASVCNRRRQLYRTARLN